MASISTRALTLADLFDQFGPIPMARIRTCPKPGCATQQDVIDLETTEDRLFELVDGVLVEKVMGHYESFLACALSHWLQNYLGDHDLGYVVGESGMMMLLPGQVRIPDVAFISWTQLGSRQVPRQPIPQIAPDLAVEVISKGNTAEEMQRKLREYFHAGVRLVWYVYPDISVVRVYTSPDQVCELTIRDTLDGGTVLPGFQMPLNQLFDPQRRSEE